MTVRGTGTTRLRLWIAHRLLPSGYRVVRRMTAEETMIRG